jgi:hypothetical protein
MEGYEVRTSDDQKVGQVVGTIGDNLIVEHGTIRKVRHLLPRVFAHVDDDERVVRASVAKAVLEDAPTVEDGQVDEQAVAQHYGLAGGEVQPETLGYGEVTAEDPARTAEEDMRAAGVTPAYERGTEVREGMRPGAEEPPRDPRFPTDTEPTREDQTREG